MATYRPKQFPECSQKRFSCVACKGGRCQILHDTHFDRPCPFYKTQAVLDREKQLVAERNKTRRSETK
jgi:hypothetical protein